MVAAIISAIPAVAHTHMVVAMYIRTIVAVMSFVVASASVVVPAVSTAIGHIEVWLSKVEVVTMRIAGIDAEVPVSSLPVKGAIEIGSCTEQIPLPGVEYVTQVQVAALPIGAEHIVITCYAHQVVQVDFIGCLVLCVCQVQFVSHLVSQEEGLSASLLV